MTKVLTRCTVPRGRVADAVRTCAAAGTPIGRLIRPVGSGVWHIRQRDLPKLLRVLGMVAYSGFQSADPNLSALWLRSWIVDCTTKGRSLIPGLRG